MTWHDFMYAMNNYDESNGPLTVAMVRYFKAQWKNPRYWGEA